MKNIRIILIAIILFTTLPIFAFASGDLTTNNNIVDYYEPVITNEYDNSLSIHSFDVNSNGDIIISVKENGNGLYNELYGKVNYALYIFNSEMTFKYGIKIKASSEIGSIWKDGYPTAVIGYNKAIFISFDENGDIVEYGDLERKDNNAFMKERTVNGKTYIMSNSKNATVSIFTSSPAEYKYLFVKDGDEITRLYANESGSTSFESKIPIITIIIISSSALIVAAVTITLIILVKKRIIKFF